MVAYYSLFSLLCHILTREAAQNIGIPNKASAQPTSTLNKGTRQRAKKAIEQTYYKYSYVTNKYSGNRLLSRSKMLILISLILLSILLWLANFQYPNAYLEKTAYSALAASIIYLLFGVILEDLVGKRIKDSKTRYSLRKVISVLGISILLVVLVSIWIVETQNILIAIGLIGAAMAFAIQDVFKNFIGGVTILLNGLYHVGDRIEINQNYGDVIDISIFYTTLLETREWVSGDQATGRLTMVPNGVILTGALHNYTRDFDFIWDEITLPITYDSDWNLAISKILKLVQDETKEIEEQAKKIMENLEGKYYFTKRSLEPVIFVTLTDNWITLGIRYITDVRSRRVLHDLLSRKILSSIQKSENIKIASGTINITGFPELKITDNEA